MPVFDWDSVGNRWVTDTLIDCNTAPVNNDDLCNKLYVDTAVGGAALFMSQYATPQLAVAAAIASGVNAIFVDDVFTITVPVNLNSDGLAFIGLGPDTGFIVNDAAATGALAIPNANVLVKDISIAVTNCVAAADIIYCTGNHPQLSGIDITFAASVVAHAGVRLNGATNGVLSNIRVDASAALTALDYGVLADTGSDDLFAEMIFVDDVDVVGISIDSANPIFCTIRIANSAQYGFYAAGNSDTLELSNAEIYNCTDYGLIAACKWAGTNIVVDTCGIGVLCSLADEGVVSGIKVLNSGTIGIKDFRGSMSAFEIKGIGTIGIETNGTVQLSSGYIEEDTNAIVAISLSGSQMTIANVGMWIRGQGVIVNGNDNWTIVGCSIFMVTAATGPGIFVTGGADGGVISGTRIEGFTEGIYIDDGAGNGYQAITGNMIETCTIGIRVGAATTHVSATGNTLRGCTTGFQLDAAALYVTMSGNDISGGTTAVSLLAGTDHCVVSDNTIYNVTADGIYLADCDYCAVNGNVIDTCGDNGIELDGNSARNKVGGNVTSTCTTDGIFLDDTCDFNLVGLNQVPDGMTMGAGVNNEHYHNMV